MPPLAKSISAAAAAPTLSLHQLSLYNTGRMAPEQVVAAFAARRPLLDRLMAEIAAEEENSRPQHHLIVGQRGMGKTMLLARIAAGLRMDEALGRRFIPLVFAEEQYAVDRLSKFWLNCLDSLADARELAQDHDAVEKIDATVSKLNKSAMRPAKDDQPFADEVYRAFEEAAHASGQRPVLLVDNLQLVFERLEERQQHSLRELLMRSGAPVLVGASPSPPPASQDYGAAFYDHFKIHYLKPLSEEEMRDLLVSLANAAGRPDVRQRVLDYPQRLKVLRQLTGGNPRTTLTLFFLYAEDFAPSVFGDLENLLDRVTPLYKARFEEQTDQQQVITSAVANHWDPVTAATLAEMTVLPPATLSAQLDRLEKTGTLERVELFGESRNGYQIAERFFNIWFLMRSASRRQRREVEFLTRFLENFYEPEDRARIARHLMSENSLSPDRYLWRCALAASLTEHGIAAELTRHTDILAVRATNEANEARARLRELIDFAALPPATVAFEDLRQKLMALVPSGAEVKPDKFAQIVLSNRQMFATGERERMASLNGQLSIEGLRAVLNFIEAVEADDVRNYSQEAVRWLSQRLVSGQLINRENCEDWNRAFKLVDNKPLCQMMVDTLPDELGSKLDKDVLANIYAKLEPDGRGSAWDWWGWGCDLHRLGAFSEAADAYRRSITLDPGDSRPWGNLGLLLQAHLGKPDEAGRSFRESVRIDAKNSIAWNNLGGWLTQYSKHPEEAEAALREALSLAPDYTEAWVNLGILLRKNLHRPEEAEKAYRKAIAIEPKNAMIWVMLGTLLHQDLQRPKEAMECYREAIKLGAKDVWAWNNLGVLLLEKEANHAEAERVFREGVELYPMDALLWNNLGVLLKGLRRFDEAEKALQKALALNPGDGRFWNNLGHLLQDHAQRFEQAEEAYRKAVKIDPESALGWKNLGYLLQEHLHRYDEAAICYQKAIEFDPKDVVPRNNLGNLLKNHFQRYDEAEHVYRDAIAIDRTFVLLWNNLGHLLHEHLQRHQEAEEAYRQAIALDSNNLFSWNGLGNLYCDFLDRLYEADKAFEHALALESGNEFIMQNRLFLRRDFLGEGAAAMPLLQGILDLPKPACPDVACLHQALFAAYEENWGVAREALAKAIELRKDGFIASTTEDWLRASAVLCHLNYGQPLIEFLEGQGDSVARLRPWVEALRALQIGDRRALHNIAPEIRTLAEVFYDGIEMRLRKLPEKTRRRPLPPASKFKRSRKH